MIIAGIAVTLVGFIVSLLSLSLSASAGGRLAIVLIGLVISLVGIFGIINRAYLKDANWRR
jgi:hypothetical protein